MTTETKLPALRKKPLYQCDASYHRTLGALRERVDAGVPLKFEDSEETGNKYTVCTLGLCDESLESSMDGVYRGQHHACPHDGRYFTAEGQSTGIPIERSGGCFYKCHIFQGSQESRSLAAQRIRTVADSVETKEVEK